MRSGIATKLHKKCPYCGGTVETVGGEDGNPFNIGRKARLVCSRCGRSVPNTEPDCFGDGDNADENGAYGLDIRPPHTGCLPERGRGNRFGDGADLKSRTEGENES